MTIHETIGQHDPFDCEALCLPYTGQRRMRLALTSGMSNGRIVIDPAAHDLIAVQCGDGPAPRLRVAAGELALSWPISFGDWLRSLVEPHDRDVLIVLHPAVEWSLAIRGGLSDFELDLSAGEVARIDINGGCAGVRLELPLPKTAVPIRVAGGVSKVTVQRPADTGVALATSGGMAKLRLDDQRFDAIGGGPRLESRNLVPGAPRYDLQISGGAAHLAIESATPVALATP
jgi:hypothetical protein